MRSYDSACQESPPREEPTGAGGTERPGGEFPWVVGGGELGKTPPCGGGSPCFLQLFPGRTRARGQPWVWEGDPPHGIGRGLAYSQSPWKRGWEWSGSRAVSNQIQLAGRQINGVYDVIIRQTEELVTSSPPRYFSGYQRIQLGLMSHGCAGPWRRFLQPKGWVEGLSAWRFRLVSPTWGFVVQGPAGRSQPAPEPRAPASQNAKTHMGLAGPAPAGGGAQQHFCAGIVHESMGMPLKKPRQGLMPPRGRCELQWWGWPFPLR